MESVAVAAGHTWEKVWNAPENRELREIRKSPHVVMPNDEVFIPPLEIRYDTIAAGRQHKVRRKGVPSKLRIRFMLDEEPRANADYRFVMPGVDRRGTTDADGILEEAVDPQAPWAEVHFEFEPSDEPDDQPDPLVIEDDEQAEGEADEQDDDAEDPPRDLFRFNLRHLDPCAEISGAQARLHLLGYYVDEIDGELDQSTREGLLAFQAEHDLEETGELDDATQAKLAEYGEG